MIIQLLNSHERSSSLVVISIINYAEALLAGDIVVTNTEDNLNRIEKLLEKFSILISRKEIKIEIYIVDWMLVRSDVSVAIRKLPDYLRSEKCGGASFFFSSLLKNIEMRTFTGDFDEPQISFTKDDYLLIKHSSEYVLSHEPKLLNDQLSVGDPLWIEKNHWDDLRDLFTLRDFYFSLIKFLLPG